MRRAWPKSMFRRWMRPFYSHNMEFHRRLPYCREMIRVEHATLVVHRQNLGLRPSGSLGRRIHWAGDGHDPWNGSIEEEEGAANRLAILEQNLWRKFGCLAQVPLPPCHFGQSPIHPLPVMKAVILCLPFPHRRLDAIDGPIRAATSDGRISFSLFVAVDFVDFGLLGPSHRHPLHLVLFQCHRRWRPPRSPPFPSTLAGSAPGQLLQCSMGDWGGEVEIGGQWSRWGELGGRRMDGLMQY